jgi:hypothetical protein
MTQAEVLAQYRPIRAGICRVLREATKACSRADLNRAVKQVAPWAEAAEFEEADTAEMLERIAWGVERLVRGCVRSAFEGPEPWRCRWTCGSACWRRMSGAKAASACWPSGSGLRPAR